MPTNPKLFPTIRGWWKQHSAQHGFLSTLRDFLAICWEFLRDSTAERRRQRYGDVDYDWDNRVDTTGATISWQTRLLGLFHSPYQPTEPALFREMLESHNLDFKEFTFIDIGSGKGRALLMAADFPFRRILGIELLPELHRIAQENINRYRSDSQQCFALESVCGDAAKFVFPSEPMVLYLFNPLPEPGLQEFIVNLEKTLRENPRPVYLLYHNPLLDHVIVQSSALQKLHRTHQFAIYREREL
ncbi:MAG: class I SAM-dependent methyltransferase [Terriglobales bacterium]